MRINHETSLIDKFIFYFYLETMTAPLSCCSQGLTERKGSVVSLTRNILTENSTWMIVNVRASKSCLIYCLVTSETVGIGVLARAKSDEIPDIMEIQKAELSDDQDCFYNDPDINQMRIQVRSQV